MRINIYKQIRAFYSIVFQSKFEIRPTHISLYMFLINQNNRSNWSEWFKCPFDTIMMGACINSNKTYYKVLNELQEYKLIKYKKGLNLYKAPKISIIKLDYDDSVNDSIPAPEKDSDVLVTQLTTLLSTQLSKQLSTQQCKHLCIQLSKHIDILLTNNFKLITIENDSIEIEFEKFWNYYNKKRNKPRALKLWKNLTKDSKDKIRIHLPKYINATPDKQFRKDPATYLYNKSWNDEVIVSKDEKPKYDRKVTDIIQEEKKLNTEKQENHENFNILENLDKFPDGNIKNSLQGIKKESSKKRGMKRKI